jgi:hypothetical protein
MVMSLRKTGCLATKTGSWFSTDRGFLCGKEILRVLLGVGSITLGSDVKEYKIGYPKLSTEVHIFFQDDRIVLLLVRE